MARLSLLTLLTIACLLSSSLGQKTTWWKPALSSTWQWQLTGTLDTKVNASVFDIDMFDHSKATIDKLHSLGKKVICYINVGAWEKWRPDASKFPKSVLGRPYDPPYQDELWFNIKDTKTLRPLLEKRFDEAKAKGCDAIEPDNMDAYTHDNGFGITANDQITFNKWVAEKVHERGMACGLKNDLDQVAALHTYFDFAVNEQCVEWKECNLLLPFAKAGKPVFGVEYTGSFPSLCNTPNANKFSWLKKKTSLDPWRQSCN